MDFNSGKQHWIQGPSQLALGDNPSVERVLQAYFQNDLE